MVVASETGGLFRTFDGGISWQHLDLPNYKTIDVVKSVVAARGEVPFAPPRTPMVFVVNAGKTGLPSAVESNQPVRVIGTSFLPASRSAQPVRILFDGVVVAEAVQVRADGSFSIDIPVHHSPGEMIVTVEQRDGHRVTIEASSIDVVSGDRPDSTRAATNSGSTIQ